VKTTTLTALSIAYLMSSALCANASVGRTHARGVHTSIRHFNKQSTATVKAISERIPKPTAHPKSTSAAGPAHVGETVTIVTDGGPVKLTIDKLELTAGRVKLGDNDRELPNATEKLLVVHYTVVNIAHVPVQVDGKTIRFTALDSVRTPHVDVALAANEDGDLADTTLNPGEKMSAIKVIHVPGRGPIAALLVTPGIVATGPLHVDVTGHVEKLASPYADPQDPSGFTVLPIVSAHIGEAYPIGDCDLTLEKAEFSNDELLNYSGVSAPDSEHLYAVFTFDVNCENPNGVSFGMDNFNPSLLTADGVQTDPANAPLLNGTLNLAFDSDLPYDDDRHFRVYFVLSRHTSMGALTIGASDKGRKYTYDLSDVQKPPE
jgi:hypothetical protein